MPKTLLPALLLGAALAPSAASAAATPSLFDPPLETKTILLPPSATAAKTKLTCRYYQRFMVKEIDEGEVGAAQLSMVPIMAGSAKPACQRANVAAEKIADPSAWDGYFKGVKGDYVFLDAADGVNGALGFAVITASDAHKIFDDTALGAFESLTLAGSTMTMRYKRSVEGSCSVPHDGASCWSKIAAATGLPESKAPDCAAGYLKAKTEMAKGHCEAAKKSDKACIAAALKELDAQRWDEAPTVVVYAAETSIGPDAPSIKPVGPALACQPSD
jgi:hypothetical protein